MQWPRIFKALTGRRHGRLVQKSPCGRGRRNDADAGLSSDELQFLRDPWKTSRHILVAGERMGACHVRLLDETDKEERHATQRH